MTPTIWLASYPKSGNTWMRMLVGALSVEPPHVIDINALPDGIGIASARGSFDNCTMLESGVLTHDEIEALRPSVHQALAGGLCDDDDDLASRSLPVRFIKVHDAYTAVVAGQPLLGGAGGAAGAILIVRDPRDIAPSFAHHLGISIDAAIARMNDCEASLSSYASDRQYPQLRQRLLTWSSHVASWLDQSDIPVLLLRYEDLKGDVVEGFGRVLAFAGLSVDETLVRRAAAMTDFVEMQRQEREKGFREAMGPPGERAFFRRGQVGSWREELTHEQVRCIEAVHAPMMRRLGYELATDMCKRD